MSKKSISKEERLAQRQEYERAASIAEETFFELFKQGMPVFACDDYFEEGQHFVKIPLKWEQPMKQFFQTHESYLGNARSLMEKFIKQLPCGNDVFWVHSRLYELEAWVVGNEVLADRCGDSLIDCALNTEYGDWEFSDEELETISNSFVIERIPCGPNTTYTAKWSPFPGTSAEEDMWWNEHKYSPVANK